MDGFCNCEFLFVLNFLLSSPPLPSALPSPSFCLNDLWLLLAVTFPCSSHLIFPLPAFHQPALPYFIFILFVKVNVSFACYFSILFPPLLPPPSLLTLHHPFPHSSKFSMQGRKSEDTHEYYYYCDIVDVTYERVECMSVCGEVDSGL